MTDALRNQTRDKLRDILLQFFFYFREDENIIDMEDILMCKTDEEGMTDIITFNSKEEDDIFVDKVIEDNDNIR